MEQAKLDYKAAIAKRDYETALGIVLKNPGVFWTPPPGAPVEIAAIATDPSEPKYMMLEWSVQKNTCKKPAGCSEYTLRSRQFDHKPKEATEKELKDWFQKYVDNRTRAYSNSKKKLGVTLYLLEVKKIKRITDFEGKVP